MPKTKRTPERKRGKKEPVQGAEIQKTMTVSEILALVPNAEPTLREYGLHCFHCSASALENLEEGCHSHGFGDEEIDDLVEDLNILLKEKPARPETLTLTLPAARALKGIATAEDHEGDVLIVAVDGTGSFCMEFAKERPIDHHIFSHPEEPTVEIAASVLTLGRIGGATIDFREERFKLDLPEDGACGCSQESCSCTE